MSSHRRTDSDTNDAGLRPLALLCGSPLETERFLLLALKISAALAELHKQNLVHGNINPWCILVDEEAGTAQLTCLSGKSHLAYKHEAAGDLAENQSSAPYLSPEQTGRMNRAVDLRADLYSLGVVMVIHSDSGFEVRVLASVLLKVYSPR